jgi:hypothetical protein
MATVRGDDLMTFGLPLGGGRPPQPTLGRQLDPLMVVDSIVDHGT